MKIKILPLTLVLLFSTTALIAMDLESGTPIEPDYDIDMHEYRLLENLKDACEKQNIKIMKKILVKPENQTALNNFQLWVINTKLNSRLENTEFIVDKQAIINNYIPILIEAYGGAILFTSIGTYLFFVDKGVGSLLFVSGIGFLIFAIVQHKKYIKESNKLNHFRAINRLVNKIKKRNLEKEQEENKAVSKKEKLVNTPQ